MAERIRCINCRKFKELDTLRDMVRHTKDTHKKFLAAKCEFCGNGFTSGRLKDVHIALSCQLKQPSPQAAGNQASGSQN